jgi:CDP-diacylglycerol---serine O-phosphatidyltransferase
MTKLTTHVTKDGLLRRMRKHRLNYIVILPSLITLLNGIFGFAAIVFASKGVAANQTNSFLYNKLGLSYFAMSGYMILLAMVADMLDGRVARMSKNTSSFGGQLDSLCDMVSFGVAPAFLMLEVIEYKLGPNEFHGFWVNLTERFIWLAAATYIICAAIRLARFNVENEEDESAHMTFVGLPSPAAAGVIVSLVILHQEALLELSEGDVYGYNILQKAIIYSLPFLLIAVAILMVSRIRYPHIVNQYVRGKKPFAHFIRVLLLIGLIFWSIQTALVVIFCGFAAGGVLKWLYYKVMRREENIVPPSHETVLMQ